MPFEEEMALCDYLVKHLQQTFLSDNDAAAAAAANGNGTAAAAAAAPSGSGAALENDGVRLQAFKCVRRVYVLVCAVVCPQGSGLCVDLNFDDSCTHRSAPRINTITPHRRDDDDEEMWAGGAVAKKNKAKAQAGAKKKKDTITHGPDTLASFALLQIEPVRAPVMEKCTLLPRASLHPSECHT